MEWEERARLTAGHDDGLASEVTHKVDAPVRLGRVGPCGHRLDAPGAHVHGFIADGPPQARVFCPFRLVGAERSVGEPRRLPHGVELQFDAIAVLVGVEQGMASVRPSALIACVHDREGGPSAHVTKASGVGGRALELAAVASDGYPRRQKAIDKLGVLRDQFHCGDLGGLVLEQLDELAHTHRSVQLLLMGEVEQLHGGTQFADGLLERFSLPVAVALCVRRLVS